MRDSLFPENIFDLRPFQEEFGLEENCSIMGRFRLFCVPVAKENVVPSPQYPSIKFPVNSSVDRICYQIKCEGIIPPDLQVTDQFGIRTLSKLNPHLICTPAFKGEPLCGDGVIVTPPEECDDGNTTYGDSCSAECTIEAVCGDGIFDPDNEECDPTAGPFGVQDCLPNVCSNCKCPVCGDGVHVPQVEECDDGNNVGGDGCSATCGLEVCGNGTLDPGEECDDGNTTNGDGCSAECTNES